METPDPESKPPSSILIIGGGNMGAALALRWHEAFPQNPITIAETSEAKRAFLREQGLDAPEELDVPEDGFAIVVVAIKPQSFAALAPHLVELAGDATVISIMAGVSMATLREAGLAYVARVMPNTPVAIGEGMSVIHAPDLPADRLIDVQTLFDATGRTALLDQESQMHAVTAISGSGPAYVFAFMEALENAAIGMGLDAPLARALVGQTVTGAALLADINGEDPAELRRQVTSPNGTTQAALTVLDDEGFAGLIAKAAKAARSRSEALS